MIFIYAYLIVTLVFYIVLSMKVMGKDDSTTAWAVSFLNILYILYCFIYLSLKRLSIRKGTKLLGYRPRTVSDYRKLGITSKGNGIKTYLHILLIKKKDFNKWNIIMAQALV